MQRKVTRRRNTDLEAIVGLAKLFPNSFWTLLILLLRGKPQIEDTNNITQSIINTTAAVLIKVTYLSLL